MSGHVTEYERTALVTCLQVDARPWLKRLVIVMIGVNRGAE